MAVQRFRTIEEMSAAAVLVPPGDGFERFARHCARYWAIAPRTYPKGVFKFRSIAEAQSARERVADDNAARLRATGLACAGELHRNRKNPEQGK